MAVGIPNCKCHIDGQDYTSNEFGFFSIYPLKENIGYPIIITADGYKPYSGQVTVAYPVTVWKTYLDKVEVPFPQPPTRDQILLY